MTSSVSSVSSASSLMLVSSYLSAEEELKQQNEFQKPILIMTSAIIMEIQIKL